MERTSGRVGSHKASVSISCERSVTNFATNTACRRKLPPLLTCLRGRSTGRSQFRIQASRKKDEEVNGGGLNSNLEVRGNMNCARARACVCVCAFLSVLFCSVSLCFLPLTRKEFFFSSLVQVAVPAEQRPVNELTALREGPLSGWAGLELPRYDGKREENKNKYEKKQHGEDDE